MLDADHETLRAHLVPGVDLVEGADLARGDADLAQPVQQLLRCVRGEGVLDRGDHRGPVPDAVGVGREPGAVGVQAEGLGEGVPQLLAAHADLHLSAAAGEQAVGGDRGVVVALRLGHLVGHGGAGALEGVHADDRGQQRGAHDLAPAGALALVERGQHAVGPVHPGEQVGDGHTHPLRVVRAGAGQRHQPPLALDDLVVAAAPGLGAVVPEAGDGQDHQARVEPVQLLDGEAEPVQDPGAEVLDEHVGALHQLPEDPLPVLGLQVQGDGLLVAVAGEEVGGLRVVGRAHEGRSPAAGVVARAGVLDLDHPGAEVGEHHPRVRSGEGAGEVDDDGAAQGPLGGVRAGAGGGLWVHGGSSLRGSRGAVGCWDGA